MLAEFAFTPSVFDEHAQPDLALWREQLRELGNFMFPRVSAWPVVVSNLYGGSWEHAAREITADIKDQSARLLCQGLLKNAATVFVNRPCRLEWPENELMWGREAIDSDRVESIERIVATAAGQDGLRAEYESIRSISEVHSAAFWQDVSADASPAMKIQAQADLLHKICIHSEFICLITPSIYGGGDDESDFALEIIKAALNRPADFGSSEIEIHTEAPPGDQIAPAFATPLDSRLKAVCRSVKTVLAQGQQAKVIIWPKLLDRLVIAGVFTKDANGQRVRSPRWGVSMSHIARKPDEKRANSFTEWKLLKRDSLGRWFEQFCKDGVAGYLRIELVVG